MKKLSVVLALTVGLASGASPPQDFVSDHLAGPPMLVHGTGADHTLKIVFLGDGFTSQDDSIGAYRTAVDEMVNELLATEPFTSMAAALSIYRMDVISDEPGIDVPETCPEGSLNPEHQYDLPPPPDDKTPSTASRRVKNPNNVLETRWCAEDVLGRGMVKYMLGSTSFRVPEFAQASKVVPDITIVLVNDFMFGATAFENGDVVYASIGRNILNETNPDTNAIQPSANKAGAMAHVFVHELGHMHPFSLLDEYSTNRQLMGLLILQTFINESPNLSTNTQPTNWAGVVPSGVVVDCASSDPRPEIGAVPGGYGFGSNVFHAQCSCRMNETTIPGKFCPVCHERIRSQLAEKLPPK